MKYLKKFENLKEPKIGDYVICSSLGFNIPNEYKKVVKNNVGKIIDILESRMRLPDMYLVKYGKFEEYFARFQIIHFSEDKDKLNAYFTAKKYNL